MVNETQCRDMQRPRFERALLLIGSLGPLGHLPASGTVTVALVGVPLFWLAQHFSPMAQVAMVAVIAALAVGLHQWGDRVLGEKDSRKLVWDELVGFLLAIVAVPFTWQLALAAVIIERTLDIIKFPPANWVERRVPGGWGVVGDDLVAGAYTCALLHGLMRWAPHAMGLSA